MSNLQIVLLSLCNDVSRTSRMSGGPLFALDRVPSDEALTRWMEWNDSNGDYRRDDGSPYEMAFDTLAAVMEDSLSPYAWEYPATHRY